MIDVIPGRAGEIVTGLGDRAVVCDLYDEIGSAVYHDIAVGDQFEVRELITLTRHVPGGVLDLAAGSGRLTMPLLAVGRHVTALERSPSMLGILAERLASTPADLRRRCTLVRGDMRAFSLGTLFGVIVLGTTSISLLDVDGRRSLYQSVRRHLTPDGRLFMSTVEVNAQYRGPAELELLVPTGSGRAYRLFEYVDSEEGYRTVTIFPETLDTNSVDVCTTRIGMLSPDLLTTELAGAGLRVCGRHQLPVMATRLSGVLLEVEAAS